MAQQTVDRQGYESAGRDVAKVEDEEKFGFQTGQAVSGRRSSLKVYGIEKEEQHVAAGQRGGRGVLGSR